MDAVLGLVVFGCAITGLIWGALKMATFVVAAAGGIAAARFVAPTALVLIAPAQAASPGAEVLAALAVALLTATLVLIAGRGLRRGVEFLRLGWLDRLGGAALAALGAVAVLAVLLALAERGGMPASSPWAIRLSELGQTWAGPQQARTSKPSPNKTPETATTSVQQPHLSPSCRSSSFSS